MNVRTTRDVKSTGGGPVEFLVDYGEDYLKVLGGECRCCTHARATAQCRFARAGYDLFFAHKGGFVGRILICLQCTEGVVLLTYKYCL